MNVYIHVYILIPWLIFFPIGNVLRRNEIYHISRALPKVLDDVKYHLPT